jgi:hypothetical protein
MSSTTTLHFHAASHSHSPSGYSYSPVMPPIAGDHVAGLHLNNPRPTYRSERIQVYRSVNEEGPVHHDAQYLPSGSPKSFGSSSSRSSSLRSADTPRSAKKKLLTVRFAPTPPPIAKSHPAHRSNVDLSAPQTPQTRLHPLLQEGAPSSMCYDVTFAPSHLTVYHPSTDVGVSSRLRAESAVEPPTSKLVVTCDKFPWEIVVRPGSSMHSSPGAMDPHPSYVTVQDVLWALHTALHHPLTRSEWDSLEPDSSGKSKAQSKVSRAYQDRCMLMGGGWHLGAKRVDWLNRRTVFVGFRPSLSGGHLVAVFRKP